MTKTVDNIIKQGRFLFAAAILASGVELLIGTFLGYPAAFIIPWIPKNFLLEYLTGVALVAAGLCIASNLRARLAARPGNLVFLGFLILWIPRLAGNPFGVSDRTCAFETFVIGGAALTLAGICRWGGEIPMAGAG